LATASGLIMERVRSIAMVTPIGLVDAKDRALYAEFSRFCTILAQ